MLFRSVSAQVQHGFLAVAHAPAIDHPGLGQRGRQRQAGGLDDVEQLGPEDLGQGLEVEQIAATAVATTATASVTTSGGGGVARLGAGLVKCLK